MTSSPSLRLPTALPVAALFAVAGALVMMFFYAPAEAVQGQAQRIFYVHAPAGWLAYVSVAIVAVASVAVLVRPAQTARLDRIAGAAAETGLLFLSLLLIVGPLWARPIWGVWWAWDARLTSTLVLWGILAAYIAFRALTPPGPSRAKRSAVVAIIGALDVPVIHFSVIWWTTLHPGPTVVRPGQAELPGSMLLTLFVSLGAFTVLLAALFWLRLAIEDARDRVSALEDSHAALGTPSRAEV